MASVHPAGSSAYLVSPELFPLDSFLHRQNYTWHYRQKIRSHVWLYGNLAGVVEAGLMDQEDLYDAELALEAGLGNPVGYDDPAWGDPDQWELGGEGVSRLPASDDQYRDRELEAWLEGLDVGELQRAGQVGAAVFSPALAVWISDNRL